ncbi:MAG: hypothetical protein WCR23_14080 [Planctomycetota bacterium]
MSIDVPFSDEDKQSVFTNQLTLQRSLALPEEWTFKLAIIEHPSSDNYVCVYHTSQCHRLAACMLDSDFTPTPNTHARDLNPRRLEYDARLFKWGNRIMVSTSCGQDNTMNIQELHVPTDMMHEKIRLVPGWGIKMRAIGAGLAKNWTPWHSTTDAFTFYTFSLTPHTILKVTATGAVSTEYSTEWRPHPRSWWNDHMWVQPMAYRLNTPPLYIPQTNRFLSVFHTVRIARPAKNAYPNPATSATSGPPLTVKDYYHGFYEFFADPPHRVSRISSKPFIDPDFVLDPGWHSARCQGSWWPFFPLSLLLRGEKLILAGTSNDLSVAHCSLDLKQVLDSLEPVSDG